MDVHCAVAQAETRTGFRLKGLFDQTKDKHYLQQWLETEEKALVIREDLADVNATNTFDRRNYADQLMLTARAQSANGYFPEALSRLHQALEIFKSLSAADPTNSEALSDVANVYANLGQAYGLNLNKAESLKNYREALSIVQEILVRDPSNEEELATAAWMEYAMAVLSDEFGEFSEAIVERLKQVELIKRIMDISANEHNVSWLVWSYEHLAFEELQKAGYRDRDRDILKLDLPLRINQHQEADARAARSHYLLAMNVSAEKKYLFFDDRSPEVLKLGSMIAKIDEALTELVSSNPAGQ